MSREPLDAAQLDAFKQDGCLIVEGVVGESQLVDYRRQFWQELSTPELDDAVEGDPSTWPANQSGGQLPNIMALTPSLGELPAIAAIIEQLGGGRFTGGGSMTKAIFPARFPLTSGATEWQEPGTSFHIDGYNGQWSSNPQVGATLYIDPVEERGGCFSVKPGQHLPTHRHFFDNPHHIDGSFLDGHEDKSRAYRRLYETTEEPTARPLQFVGGAGAVMFWHGFTPHCASLNARDRPRLAMIARWSDAEKRGAHELSVNLELFFFNCVLCIHLKSLTEMVPIFLCRRGDHQAGAAGRQGHAAGVGRCDG
jgi:hypothetical protein